MTSSIAMRLNLVKRWLPPLNHSDLVSPITWFRPQSSTNTLFYSSFILLLFRAFCRRFLPSFYLLSCCQRCVISLDQLISHLSTSRQENKALMWKKTAVDASGDSDFKERHFANEVR
ncbi:hypothetical protein TNIN_61491 [Trichonephila inaurata madagascariensis]|uniref:Uncharacterized protein n=1 Tax=Trichonephila inaurata madagascariensis TaxID=2747483 RepID=A0A8X6XXJ8_9ARAC|nr:hypothetical protein TNIN_61491 [Trichonephila inaurata madagascariensis]